MAIGKKFFEFILWLSVVTLFLLVIYQLLYIFWPETPPATYMVYVVLIPYVVTALIYLLQLKAITMEPQYFVQIIILSIVVKLILFASFNFVIIYLSPEQAMANVISFFVIYLSFTTLELVMLYPLIKQHNEGMSKSIN